MTIITYTEASVKFPEVIKLAMAGEEVVITKKGTPAVTISPYQEKKTTRLGFMEGQAIIPDDFDKWPEDIAKILGIKNE